MQFRLSGGGDGNLEYDPRGINTIFREFYVHLYTSESGQDQGDTVDFLSALNLPKLSEGQAKTLDQPITVGEILEVIRLLPTSKAPG